MTFDNLPEIFSTEAKHVYIEGEVLLFPPTRMKEPAQEIDAGHGMSTSFGVGQSLYEWLMVEASMKKW